MECIEMPYIKYLSLRSITAVRIRLRANAGGYPQKIIDD